MKKYFIFLFSFLFILNVSAFDITQELDNKWGNIQLDNNISIDLQENTFDTSVVFSAKTVNDIEWFSWDKYDDKWFGSFSLSFKNKSGESVEPKKSIKIWVIWLDSYKTPVLLKSNSWSIEEIKWEDDLWTFVFDLGVLSVSSSYKLVDSDWTLANTLSSTWTNLNNTETSNTENEDLVVLENKEETWVNSLMFFFLILIGLLWTIAFRKGYTKV